VGHALARETVPVPGCRIAALMGGSRHLSTGFFIFKYSFNHSGSALFGLFFHVFAKPKVIFFMPA